MKMYDANDEETLIKLQTEYEILKQQFGSNQVDMAQRSLEVSNYLKDIIATKRNFDEAVGDTKASPRKGDRLGEMDDFVQNVLDEKKRQRIQSFILDERVKEGIMCKKFVEKLSKNMSNSSLEEIFEFIEQLIQHFSNDSFHISKIFPDQDLTDVQLLVKVLIYTCVFLHLLVIRDAIRICLDVDRGKQEYKYLKKVKKYAYFVSKVEDFVGVS